MTRHNVFRVGLAAGLLVLAALAGGCRSASIDSATVEKTEAQATQVPSLAGALPAVPIVGSIDYRVGPLDALDIEVYGAEDLTRSVRVTQAGEISLPLIGRVHAGGLTVTELENEIARHLKENFMEDPQVSVFVKEYMSQRVTVEGAVRQPGIYSLTGRTSLLQIIALSNGLDDLANPKGIVIYRNLDGKRFAAAFDIREVRAGRMVDPEVLGNDIVVVDYSGARSNSKDFLATIPALALFVLLL
jgi:polysaccharide export outer membrane protein